MTEIAFDKFWDLLTGALSLNPEAFKLITEKSLGLKAALCIVFLAGFSVAIAQSIILFANRVKPVRFIFSLVIASILYAFGYVFWTSSTWLVANFLFVYHLNYGDVARILGLSYAPELFSFLIALPYLGMPISSILSIWSFLTFLTGLKVLLANDIWLAFSCGAIGWVVFEILQRTVGRPVAAIGHWLTNSVAGVQLVTNIKDVEKMVK